MKTTKKALWYFFIDKSVYVLFIVLSSLYLTLFYSNNKLIIVYIALTFFSFGYLGRSLLLLPFDIIVGSCKKTAVYDGVFQVEKYEIFRKKHFCVLRFLFDGKRIYLAYPYESEESLKNMPKESQETEITFFKYSKILLSLKT